MEHIPRPPNRFIIYRADIAPTLPPPADGQPRTQGEISRLISERWESEPSEVKAEYERRAQVKKYEHQAKYPNYKYQPKPKAVREKERRMGLEAPRKRRRARAKKKAGLPSATSHPSAELPSSSLQMSSAAASEPSGTAWTHYPAALNPSGGLSSQSLEDSQLEAQSNVNDVSRDHSDFSQENSVHSEQHLAVPALDVNNGSKLNLQPLDTSVVYTLNTFGDSASQNYGDGALAQFRDDFYGLDVGSSEASPQDFGGDWTSLTFSDSSLAGHFDGTQGFQIDPVANMLFDRFSALYGTYEDVTTKETSSSQSATF
ncbi:hypothetical protein DXG03_007696 [Asterophora parasitica]|uniref:HMG box domain-containing protein n=1 Tax=Asterophora parasitica TaxID=117018 RepID=A0A9P7FYZ6_9AGAR|nr:hypothetical protein DXG03_007696 [Asterophora parasitica]